MLPNFSEIRLSDIVDVLIVAAMLWTGIVWLQVTRARMALLGIAILGAFYVVVQQLGFQLTTWLLQGFFAVVVLILVVVFQDDLRRLFERIAIWGLRRQAPTQGQDEVDILVSAAARLAQLRTGAIIVVSGRESLERHLEGGTALQGHLSEALLLSLFETSSPGHDGAVILSGSEVVRFGAQLPLSNDWDRLGRAGTRHAASLGLAERTDAFCIVVSEERGIISTAEEGELTVMSSPEALASALRGFIARRDPSDTRRRTRLSPKRVAQRTAEGAVAIAIAAGLWFVTVPGATITQHTRTAAVVVDNLPDGYSIDSIEPPHLEVVVEGPRRNLYLSGNQELVAHIDALLVQLGRRTFQINEEQIIVPNGLSVSKVSPKQVRISVTKDTPKNESR